MNNFSTTDGTGFWDYIHTVDLAEEYLRAIEALQSRMGVHFWNLDTGRGYIVLELLRAFEGVSGKSVPYRTSSLRPGVLRYALKIRLMLKLN